MQHSDITELGNCAQVATESFPWLCTCAQLISVLTKVQRNSISNCLTISLGQMNILRSPACPEILSEAIVALVKEDHHQPAAFLFSLVRRLILLARSLLPGGPLPDLWRTYAPGSGPAGLLDLRSVRRTGDLQRRGRVVRREACQVGMWTLRRVMLQPGVMRLAVKFRPLDVVIRWVAFKAEPPGMATAMMMDYPK
jgi:hypothetical protein